MTHRRQWSALSRFSVIGVLLSLLAFGCTANVVTHATMSGLSLGMSPEQSVASVGQEPKYVFRTEGDDGAWTAHYYRHSSGNVGTRYLLLFNDEGLRYWGFPHEFERQRNEEIARVARWAEVEYDKAELQRLGPRARRGY